MYAVNIFIDVNGIQDMFIYLIKYNYNDWYYIGKTSGSLEKRYISHKHDCKKNRTTHHRVWNKALKEGKVPEIILLEKTNKDNINEKEKHYISYFKKAGIKLTNLTDGGDGLQGHIFSEEHKEKISQNRKGKYITTQEHINAIKMANSHPRSEEFKLNLKQKRTGTKWSEETKKKISESNKGKHNNNNRQKPIIQMDLSNNILNVFNSINEAALHLNPDKFKSLRSSIECAANPKGKQKTACGYLWKYKN